MLCYNGLADDASNEHKAVICASGRRIGASITAVRQTHPKTTTSGSDSEHVSVALAPAPQRKSPAPKTAAKNGAARWREARRWAIISRNDSN